MLRLAVLGDPVARSRSPVMHTAALEHVGIDGAYLARQVDLGGFELACTEIRSGRLDGANVTMPYKRDALRLADAASAEAAHAGAANTLSRSDAGLQADNTDVGGILDVWARRALPDEGPILVLGTGGAAAAALVALQQRSLRVSGRRPEAAEALVFALGIEAMVVPWGNAVEGSVLVNATPLGMRGESLPDAVLGGAEALFDMAYGAEPTPATRRMEGRPVADGIDLLVAQAARSFEIWTGQQAPRTVMEHAARS